MRSRWRTTDVFDDGEALLGATHALGLTVLPDGSRRTLVSKQDNDALKLAFATGILGADAQTLSWSYVESDFPYLQPSNSAVAKALRMATGSDLLKAQVLKVSHHGSKHGVNLELVERIHPALTLVSCVDGGGSYHFPHTVAQELIREALEPTTTSGAAHKKDCNLDVYYTCDTTDADERLGSFAVVMGARKLDVWRFGDGPADEIDLGQARLLQLARD